MEMGNVQGTLASTERQVQLAQQSGLPEHIGKAYATKADYQQAAGDLEIARSAGQVALDYQTATQDERGQYSTHFTLARVERELDHYDDARKHCADALNIATKYGNQRIHNMAELELARIEMLAGNGIIARDCCNKLLVNPDLPTTYRCQAQILLLMVSAMKQGWPQHMESAQRLKDFTKSIPTDPSGADPQRCCNSCITFLQRDGWQPDKKESLHGEDGHFLRQFMIAMNPQVTRVPATTQSAGESP